MSSSFHGNLYMSHWRSSSYKSCNYMQWRHVKINSSRNISDLLKYILQLSGNSEEPLYSGFTPCPTWVKKLITWLVETGSAWVYSPIPWHSLADLYTWTHDYDSDLHILVTWLSHDYHMTVTWLSHDCHMTATWLSHDCHMIMCCKLHVYLFMDISSWRHRMFVGGGICHSI